MTILLLSILGKRSEFMLDNKKVLDTLWNDYLKIAEVNIVTGEYHFVKIMPGEDEKKCLEGKDYPEYSAIMADNFIHPDDAAEYRRHTDLEYLQKRLFGRRNRTFHNFRRKIDGKYKWIYFEMVLPSDFSRDNPWGVLTWKETDNDTCDMTDAMEMLSHTYYKILKINLTEDAYEIIKAHDSEMSDDKAISEKISEWFKRFAELGNVYENDLKAYRKFTDMSFLKKHFKSSREVLRCRYRRKIGDTFRWALMEIIPSMEYTDEMQIVMMYIRDIHDNYIAELQYQKELEYYCNYDALTDIKNRHSYNDFCADYEKNRKGAPLAVIFADVNGLKYVNDNYGHDKGDEYIRTFSSMLAEEFGHNSCYRISGDEFLVISETSRGEEFIKAAEAFRTRINAGGKAPAAIGCAWSAAPVSVGALVKEAETAMYSDKSRFYKQNTQFDRRNH